MVDWFDSRHRALSVTVEQDVCNRDLRALPWSSFVTSSVSSSDPLLLSASPLTLECLLLWLKIWTCFNLSTENSPLTSLFDNSAFPVGIGVSMISTYIRTACPTAREFVCPSSGLYKENPDVLHSQHLDGLTCSQLHRSCKKLLGTS